jgi:hypothetical protein
MFLSGTRELEILGLSLLNVLEFFKAFVSIYCLCFTSDIADVNHTLSYQEMLCMYKVQDPNL